MKKLILICKILLLSLNAQAFSFNLNINTSPVFGQKKLDNDNIVKVKDEGIKRHHSQKQTLKRHGNKKNLVMNNEEAIILASTGKKSKS